eukprot:TRINITY_DN696_c0_g1_i1.p1 TRINITY_DN696_c0_g1~~TRINITY_DN696_c0_g1_i1.p1  ORF type:complete len:451 (+),score=108.51 TRINITY_DN696_c0_g1_i1:61-1413(+)
MEGGVVVASGEGAASGSGSGGGSVATRKRNNKKDDNKGKSSSGGGGQPSAGAAAAGVVTTTTQASTNKKKTTKSTSSSFPANNKLIHAPDSAGSASSFWAKLARRIAVGITLISVFTGILLTDHLYVALLVIVVQAVAFKEIILVRHQNSGDKEKMPGFVIANLYFLLLTFFYFYAPAIAEQLRDKLPQHGYQLFLHYHMFICFQLYVFGFVVYVLSLEQGKYRIQFEQFAWTAMTLLVVIGQSGVLFANIFDGLIWFLVPCCAIVFNDIMAFVCGLLFGRKIVPFKFLALSPNKTWEGFLGAAFWTVLFSYFFAGFLAQYKWFICPKTLYSIGIGELDCVVDPVFVPTHYDLPSSIVEFLHNTLQMNITRIEYVPFQLHAIWFGLFASFITPFGGFFTSGLKRAFDVKDFDNLFPGHGGMTDRMDCQMLMGLCVYVHIKTFTAAASFPN